MATCDPAALLEAGSGFQGLTEKEVEIVTAELLRQWAGSTATPEELLEAGKCFACLETKQLELIKTQLLCNLIG